MTQSSYSYLFRDPRWKAKRAAVLERDGNQCVYCCARHSLQVHNTTYRKNRYPWEYRCGLSEEQERHEYDLITLCDACHESEHDFINETKKSINRKNSEEFLHINKLIDNIVKNLDVEEG